MMVEGTKYLLNNLPSPAAHNVYYWYYATQVMHNYFGYEWDTWNRAMRKLLVQTQVRDVNCCANGSWNPSGDQWVRPGRTTHDHVPLLPDPGDLLPATAALQARRGGVAGRRA